LNKLSVIPIGTCSTIYQRAVFSLQCVSDSTLQTPQPYNTTHVLFLLNLIKNIQISLVDIQIAIHLPNM